MPERVQNLGLSPPTRGNHESAVSERDADGSIPAHAGEPRQPCAPPTCTPVYPRPRGGTPSTRRPRRGCPGLSPPTRGNRQDGMVENVRPGSIPAHAGEPATGVYVQNRREVYPRPRGGTSCPSGSGFMRRRARGLSPPTRGNPPSPRPDCQSERSIPAHAGEPYLDALLPQSVRVYPRPRGGTSASSARISFPRGLSPPTRGNLG